MKKYVWVIISGVMILAFQNCAQDVQFKQASIGELGTGVDLGTPGQSQGEQFKVIFNSEAAPLDMVWVIDNSGSMSEEAALVRRNFSAFLTELNKNTNFRLALISATEAMNRNYGVTLPNGFDPANHLQISQTVGSTNGPQILLNNFSTLSQFLRMDSKKILVFVTDDNSNTKADQVLNSLVGQGWSSNDVSVSAFIGLGAAQSKCQASTGTQYQTLASQTGGKTYNICDADWTAHFNDLLNVSVLKAVRRFTLTKVAAPKEVLEVKVDGQTLSKADYALKGNILTLNDGVNLHENSMVDIQYK